MNGEPPNPTRSLSFREYVPVRPSFTGRSFNPKDDLCFVVMPLSVPRLDTIFEEVIKPTLEGLNLTVHRSDMIMETGTLMESIWTSIFESRMVVAELTGRNPNVYYEVGLADTVGVPVIPLTQELPRVFDVQHKNHIVYEDSPAGLETLKQKLRGMAEAVLAKPAMHWGQ